MAIYSVLKKEWILWNLRIAVLSSLCLQIVLIFLSPLRKRTRRIWINPIIWLCYLMADWVAVYSIGVIVNQSRDSCDDGKGVDRDLAAFWAPFLLLHLGGPDTITAFSIQDNELWMRHLLSMIVEVSVVLYVLFLAIPSNALWLPFLLVFVAGTIKYAERTRALYLACYGNIHEWWIGVRSMEEYGARVQDHVLLQAAYGLYEIFRNLVHSQTINWVDYLAGCTTMDGLEPEKAFNVVAAELSFIYDELFTKMATVHGGRGGWFSYFLRLICSALIVSAFVVFSTTKKLKVPHNVDIAVTYALLVGAIFLDFIAVVMLVFSDRTIAFLKDCPKASKMVHSIYRKMHCYNSGWCESISQHNFINYCMIKNQRRQTLLEKWFEATVKYLGLTTTFEELRYKYDKNVSRELKEFIYNYLKKFQLKRDLISSSRGKSALSRYQVGSQVVNRSVEIEYEISLFVWHIATDCLYFTRDHSRGGDNRGINHSEICKVISDHMFYLYIMRPSLISTHQGGVFQTRLKETCEDARRVLEPEELSEQRDVCEKLLSQHKDAPNLSGDYTGHRFVWQNASILANHLQRNLEERDDMWEVMSHVWLEMLCYGAYRTRGDMHAQQLTKGGEFITHVWLLMAHYGLNDCLAENEATPPFLGLLAINC